MVKLLKSALRYGEYLVRSGEGLEQRMFVRARICVALLVQDYRDLQPVRSGKGHRLSHEIAAGMQQPTSSRRPRRCHALIGRIPDNGGEGDSAARQRIRQPASENDIVSVGCFGWTYPVIHRAELPRFICCV